MLQGKLLRHVVFRITWARAMARGVCSPAGAGPRGRRALRSPGGPERSSAPAPPRGRAAARAGRAASSSRATPRRGASLAGRPAPLTRSRALGGHGADGREEGAPESGRTRTRAPPPEPLRYRSGDDDQDRGLLPTCREDTEHARAETTSG